MIFWLVWKSGCDDGGFEEAGLERAMDRLRYELLA